MVRYHVKRISFGPDVTQYPIFDTSTRHNDERCEIFPIDQQNVDQSSNSIQSNSTESNRLSGTIDHDDQGRFSPCVGSDLVLLYGSDRGIPYRPHSTINDSGHKSTSQTIGLVFWSFTAIAINEIVVFFHRNGTCGVWWWWWRQQQEQQWERLTT